MGWKEWPNWVKGAIIGLGAAFTPVGWLIGMILYLFLSLIFKLPKEESAIAFIFIFGFLFSPILGAIGGKFTKQKENNLGEKKEGTYNILSFISFLISLYKVNPVYFLSFALSTISIFQIIKNKQKGLWIAILAWIISTISISKFLYLLRSN